MSGGFVHDPEYPAIRPSLAQVLIVAGGLVATISVLLPWLVSGTPEAGDATSFAARSGLDFWRGLLLFVLGVLVTLVGLQLWQTPLTAEVVEDRTVVSIGLGAALVALGLLVWFLGDVRADFGGNAAGVFQGGPFGGADDGTVRNLIRDFDPRLAIGWWAATGGTSVATIGLVASLVRPPKRAEFDPYARS